MTSILSDKALIIVEDDSTISLLLEEIATILKVKSFETRATVDEALLLIKDPNYIFDFMILDIQLPGNKTGVDLVTYLFDNHITMPILVYSANLKGYKSKFLKYTLSDFLTIKFLEKPASYVDLIQNINETITLHNALRVETVELPRLQKEITDLKIFYEQKFNEQKNQYELQITEVQEKANQEIQLLKDKVASLDENFIPVIRKIILDEIKNNKGKIIIGLTGAFVTATGFYFEVLQKFFGK